MQWGSKKILEDLRAARVLVVHPRDEDGEMLIGHLRRIGCEVRAAWPMPLELPSEIDTLFVLAGDSGIRDLPARFTGPGPAIVAVVAYESPTTLKEILDLNAHGVVNKPIRPSGILTSLVVARYRCGYESRLNAKVAKLEETLKARREIEKATRILMGTNGIPEDEAYRMIRDQATERRVTIAQIAANIAAAHETLHGLGLGIATRDRPKRERKA